MTQNVVATSKVLRPRGMPYGLTASVVASHSGRSEFESQQGMENLFLYQINFHVFKECPLVAL